MEITGRELPDGSRWDREAIVREDPVLRRPTADETFRPPTADETARLARALGEAPPLVVAFEADAGGCEPVSCPVVAERPDILPGLVPRHPRAGAGTAPAAHDWPGPPLPTD